MGALFSMLASSIVGSIAARFGERVAIAAAVLAMFVASVSILATSINGIAGAILPVMPELLQTGLSWMPSNLGTCISAVISIDLAVYAYRQVVTIIQIKSRV